MIYTLTFNASLDYVAFTDSVSAGSIHKLSEYHLFPGGKGINVSQVLNSLNVDNEAWGFVASVTGDCLEKLLKDKGIKSDFIPLANGLTRINVKLRHREDGKIIETDFNGVGPKVTDEEILALRNKLETLKEQDIVIMSGSIPESITVNIFEDLLAILNRRNIRFVADVTGEYLMAALRHKPFLVKPNEDEAEQLLDRGADTIEEALDCAGRIAMLGADNVIISLGHRGAVLVTADEQRIFMPSPQGNAINTVGAGDSMVAGFVAEFLRNGDYRNSLRVAVCCGAATAFSEGLAAEDDIKGLINGFFG